MVDRRVEVVGRLKVLEESAAPLISFLQNPALVQELRSDKQYNLQMLQERYQVGSLSKEAFLFASGFRFSIFLMRKGGSLEMYSSNSCQPLRVHRVFSVV